MIVRTDRNGPAGRTGRRTRRVLTGTLVLGLVATGLSGSSAAVEHRAVPVTDTVAASTSASPADGTLSVPAKKKKRNVISWILSLGPGAPIGPPEFTAYRELQQLRCANVFERVGELGQPARRLYKGAAKACLAALDGRTRMWRGADAAYVAVAPRSAELTCMDQAALGLLRRLVVLHRKFPNRQFRLAPSTQSKAPPCPDITALSPDHGTTGTSVLLTGSNLIGPVSSVLVVDSNGASTEVDGLTATLDGALRFSMPALDPPPESPVVCVVVRAEPAWSADGSLFTYDDVPDTSAAAPPACPPPDGS